MLTIRPASSDSFPNTRIKRILTIIAQIPFICVPLHEESSRSVCRWYIIIMVKEESPGNAEHPTS